MQPTSFDHSIDLSALPAPLPLLHARRALGKLGAGQVLRVQARGGEVSRDFLDFAKLTGCALKTEPAAEGRVDYFLQKR
jgi:tRNA 2-thiouridine synthesizing protein A